MNPSLPKFVFKLLSVTVQLVPSQKGNDDVWLWWSNSTKICNSVNVNISLWIPLLDLKGVASFASRAYFKVYPKV